MNINIYQSIVIVVGIVGLQLLGKMVTYFWDKVVRDVDDVPAESADDEYVKKSFCRVCEKKGQGEDARLAEDLKIVRGILLIVAVAVGVPADKLRGLTQ